MLRHKFVPKMLIIVILVLIIVLITYRFTTRKILDASIVNIHVEKVDKYLNSAMGEQQKTTILQNLDEYRYVVYSFNAKDISDKARVTNISIQPIFLSEMKNNVYWYDKTDAITDSQMCLEPYQLKNYSRTVLIKKNGHTDDELISMAKNDRFKITYFNFIGGSFFSFGHDKKVIEYKEN